MGEDLVGKANQGKVLPSLETVVGEVGPQLPACRGGGMETPSQPSPRRTASWLHPGRAWGHPLERGPAFGTAGRRLAPGRLPRLLVRRASGSQVPGLPVPSLRIPGTLRRMT